MKQRGTNRCGLRVGWGVPILLLVSGDIGSGLAQQQAAPVSSQAASAERETIARFANLYCVDCHNSDDKTAGLALDALSLEDVDRHPRVWEKVVRKLVAR